MNVVRNVERFNAELLTLKGRPNGWRTGRTSDANAIVVAKFDGAEETLGKRLTG